MGFKTFGFSFGRPDIWAPEDDIYWGPEDEWLDEGEGSLHRLVRPRPWRSSLGAVQMGLIYVNPAGPNGVPDVLAVRAATSARRSAAWP